MKILAIDDQQLVTGQTYTVDFKAKDFQEVLGYQFTLQFDQSQLRFVDFENGALSKLDADNLLLLVYSNYS